nr:putative ribonuclease H-like domain-containing protein [Tanacetum cinerariifolium]
MHNNSEGKTQQVEDHCRNFKFSNNKMFVTACNDSLNAKTLNVNFVCVTCGKCVLNDNHDMCVLHYINGTNSRTKMPMVVPISTREPKRTMNQSTATPLKRIFAQEGIKHRTSTARTPEQNSIVERRNHTLVEATRTMLSAAKVPLFFWDEAIATTCFTQNRSLVIPRHEKTSYHIIDGRKLSVKFFHIFGSLCYIVGDRKNFNKMKEKGCVLSWTAFCQSTAFCLFEDHLLRFTKDKLCQNQNCTAFCLRPNGEALKKCILSGPYKPTTVLVQAVEVTDDSPAVPEHTIVETPTIMSPKNKAYFLAEKEAIHLILTGIGDDIYSTVDACQTAQEMWEAIERLQQGHSEEGLFVMDDPRNHNLLIYGVDLDD